MADHKSRPSVEYVAPPREAIESFSRTVCKALSKELEEEFDTPSVWIDLAAFLEVVAAICTKQQNQQVELVDKSDAED